MLQADEKFKTILDELVAVDFESNLNEQLSSNDWRLFCYRKSISEFNEISTIALLQFTDEVFSKLLSVINNQSHKYFDEMRTTAEINLDVIS